MELGSEYNLSLADLSVKEETIFKYLSPFPYKSFFDSGRSALRHLAGFFNGGEILLPEFICESVINCFNREQIHFYRLHADFSVDIDSLESKITGRTQAVFLMHYFGGLQPQAQLQQMKSIAAKHHLVIIEDTTHSIFSESSTIGDYQVCSLRKWMAIPSGGVLYAHHDPLGVFGRLDYAVSRDNGRSYGMVLKDLFLSSGFDCNAEYRKIFRACEERLDRRNDISLISDFSRFIASCTDLSSLKKKRMENYGQLNDALRCLDIKPLVQLQESDCPLVFPIRVQNRDQFRKYLMEKKIYCAVHWPFDGVRKEERIFAEECAETLISLPIDQRYGQSEISYLAETICCYGEKLNC